MTEKKQQQFETKAIAAREESKNEQTKSNVCKEGESNSESEATLNNSGRDEKRDPSSLTTATTTTTTTTTLTEEKQNPASACDELKKEDRKVTKVEEAEEQEGPSPHRVKLYKMGIDTNWEDKGTGYCVYHLGNNGKSDQITVYSEEDNSVLLQSTILKKRLYQKQQETLIIWSEDVNHDLALSFQDPEGCEEIWRRIHKLQNGISSSLKDDTEDMEVVLVKSNECTSFFADDDVVDEDDIDDMNGLENTSSHNNNSRRSSSSPDYELELQYTNRNRLTTPKKRITLPEPDLSNLNEISTTLSKTRTMLEKDKIATFVAEQNFAYLDKLLMLFDTCEDLESVTDLHRLYTVIMGILKLTDQSLIEHLVDDEHLDTFMGILEYNPLTPTMKATHREVIKNHSSTHHTLYKLLREDRISKNVQQTFRLGFLQHVIQEQALARKPPPPITSTPSINSNEEYQHKNDEENQEEVQEVINFLSTLISQNHVEFINHIQVTQSFLIQLFEAYQEAQKQQSTVRQDEIIQLVGQICYISRQMQNSLRMGLYRSLANFGLFDIMCIALRRKKFKSMFLTILENCVNADVAMVRGYLIEQAEEQAQVLLDKNPKLTKTKLGSDIKDAVDKAAVAAAEAAKKPLLIKVIVEEFVSDGDYGSKVQYFEILKSLLDSNNSNSTTSPLLSSTNSDYHKHSPAMDDFIQDFYDEHMKVLLSPIQKLDIKPISLKGPIEPLELTPDQADLCEYICKFLYFAVKNHGHRSKYVICSTDLLVRLMQLYRSTYASLKLAALRFFRICISLNDNFYNQTFVKHNVFEPAIRVFLDTNGKDCLLNSAFLELIECIRKENMKPLIHHLITQFGSVLDTITYISTFKQLKLKYEQNTEPMKDTMLSTTGADSASNKTGKREGWASSIVDLEEEEYFATSDDDEDEGQDDVLLKRSEPKIPKISTNDTASFKALNKRALVNYDDDDDSDDDVADVVVQDNGSDHKIQQEQQQSPTNKRKFEEIAKEDVTTETAESTSTPPPLKSRKTDEDEDDVFARRLSSSSTTKSGSISSAQQTTNTAPTIINANTDTNNNSTPSSSPSASAKSGPRFVIKTSPLKRTRSESFE